MGPIGALLETALHDTWGRDDSLQRSSLDGLMLKQYVCRSDIRVADLSDSEITRWGMKRSQIVSTSPEHYTCTRAWAQPRARVSIGGHQTSGFMWNSRQAELAAQYATAPVRILLTLAPQTSLVAVVYDHDGTGDTLFESRVLNRDLSRGTGINFVRETATTFGIFVDE